MDLTIRIEECSCHSGDTFVILKSRVKKINERKTLFDSV